MPKRGPEWLPKLQYHAPRKCGRVKIPGKGVVYLGTSGCWPDRKRKPPRIVIEEYDREVATWLRHRGEDGRGVAPAPGLTISELCAAFLRHCQRWYRKRGKPTSTVGLFRRAVRAVRLLFGSLPAADFTSANLRLVRDHLRDSGSLNRATINGQLQRIKRMFSWAVEEELVPEEVWLRLTTVKGIPLGRGEVRESQPVRPVEEDRVLATLPHLPPVVAAMVQVQQLSGMRPEEVCGMRAQYLSEEKDLLRYTVPDEWNKMAHKGQKRIIWIGPKAQAILIPFLRLARQREDGVLWPMTRGEGSYTPRHYGRVIRHTCDRTGIARWAPNMLRHARATRIREDFGLDGVQAELGHASIAVSQHYAQKSEELARRIAREQG